MIVVDVNVLVAAAVADHPRHAETRSWLAGELGSADRGVLIPDLVWVGLVRIVTNRRVFTEPLSIEQITQFAEAVVAAPGYLPSPGEAGPGGFLGLCAAASAVGNLVPDAYLASVALRLGCPVATFDRDFRRFDGLEIRELAPGG
ncbi:MAG: PIN domain-containing protein [Bifidobacteriaceae bacterium]|nr:PIN domain-containing protein [Bifidobacteriaceae bacterium]